MASIRTRAGTVKATVSGTGKNRAIAGKGINPAYKKAVNAKLKAGASAAAAHKAGMAATRTANKAGRAAASAYMG